MITREHFSKKLFPSYSESRIRERIYIVIGFHIYSDMIESFESELGQRHMEREAWENTVRSIREARLRNIVIDKMKSDLS